jgi:hypothetical protein
MAVLKEYAIDRRGSCKHKGKYKNCVGAPSRERKEGLE